MALFPPESLIHIGPSLSTLLRTCYGTTQDPDQFRTNRNRCIHMLKFFANMKLDDDFFLEWSPIERCNWQMALYAMYLGCGNTLMHRQIQCVTVKAYIAAGAHFLQFFNGERDVRFAKIGDRAVCMPLQKVYNEITRYERVPDRREPIIHPGHA